MSRRTDGLAAWVIAAALVLVAGGVGGCKKSPYDKEPEADSTGPYAMLENLLPKSKELDGWVRGAGMQHFAPAGAMAIPAGPEAAVQDVAASAIGPDAAMFQEYGYKMSVVQQYIRKNSATDIVVAIHEMAEPNDAFGVFSVYGAGERVAGAWLAAKKSPGVLCVAKGRYLVIVQEQASSTPPSGGEAPGEGAVAEPLVAFAEAVAGKIFSGTAMPALVERLPSESMVAGSEVYVRGPLGLQKVGALRPGDRAAMAQALGSGAVTRVAMAIATYRPSGGNSNTVFLISYGTAQDAEVAGGALDTYLQGATGDVRNAIAWTAVRNYLVGTVNAEEESVQRVLPKLIADLGG